MTSQNRTKLLLVDDDSGLRWLYTRWLRSVMPAIALGPRPALTWLESNADTVAAVISDYKMPQIDGLELYERIRSDWPWLVERFAFCSSSIEPGLAATGRPVFPKFSDAAELSAAIETLL